MVPASFGCGAHRHPVQDLQQPNQGLRMFLCVGSQPRVAAPTFQHMASFQSSVSRSLYEPGKILSLSFFRDEAAVQAWRTTNEHRVAQAKGRGEIFSNYRLRVAGVIRDYGMREREQAPDDSRKIHRV